MGAARAAVQTLCSALLSAEPFFAQVLAGKNDKAMIRNTANRPGLSIKCVSFFQAQAKAAWWLAAVHGPTAEAGEISYAYVYAAILVQPGFLLPGGSGCVGIAIIVGHSIKEARGDEWKSPSTSPIPAQLPEVFETPSNIDILPERVTWWQATQPRPVLFYDLPLSLHKGG
ncbi:hypothetical protein B0T22DRAFT_532365 [Podospora appendiculata]|uniref:Uncharacterized protein n=1 Tax=Podospora appendiculata TaxID=314037 RepID=A0AAE0XGH1_9PEZI|nr:hypothetical protein B0T22DRAFT_532365 [Podospora appendiculata]